MVRFSEQQWNFSLLQNIQTQSGGQPAPYSMSSGDKAANCVADHSLSPGSSNTLARKSKLILTSKWNTMPKGQTLKLQNNLCSSNWNRTTKSCSRVVHHVPTHQCCQVLHKIISPQAVDTRCTLFHNKIIPVSHNTLRNKNIFSLKAVQALHWKYEIHRAADSV